MIASLPSQKKAWPMNTVAKATSARRTKSGFVTESFPIIVMSMPNWIRSQCSREMFISALVFNISLFSSPRHCVAIWMSLPSTLMWHLMMIRLQLRLLRLVPTSAGWRLVAQRALSDAYKNSGVTLLDDYIPAIPGTLLALSSVVSPENDITPIDIESFRTWKFEGSLALTSIWNKGPLEGPMEA